MLDIRALKKSNCHFTSNWICQFTRLPQQHKVCQFSVIITVFPFCEVFMLQTFLDSLSRLLITDPVSGCLCVCCVCGCHRGALQKQLAFADSTLLIILPCEAFMCSIHNALG